MTVSHGGAIVDLVADAAVPVVFGLLFWRVVVNRKTLPRSTKALGTVIYEDVQNRDGEAAVEEIVYAQDDWTQDDRHGGPPEKGDAKGATGKDAPPPARRPADRPEPPHLDSC